ncbi:MAG: response regulator [Planctomycetota bacterium]|nr:response regulator [Planctomycetota bacterium]MCZ6691422.1 response regulator [Planctomycetota bacterium]
MKKILVVDDEAKIRDLLTSYLSSIGYAVETACSGSDLLLRNAAGYDLILLDVKMPGLSAYTSFKISSLDVAERSELPSKTYTPTIIVTGYPNDMETKLLLKDPAIMGIVQKPFELDHLRAKIEDVLGREEPVPDPV